MKFSDVLQALVKKLGSPKSKAKVVRTPAVEKRELVAAARPPRGPGIPRGNRDHIG